MLIFGYRVQALRSVLTGLFFVVFTTSCSFLKLDKEKNCLNDKAACFKADFTAPRLKQVIYPQEGAFVSVIDYVELMFTEELNNPKPSDFNFSGAANITVNSVQKINDYTYRLSLTQNLLDSGSIYLDFPNLRDYNDNKIAGQTTVSYTGNVGIPITLESVNHTGLSSTSAYDTLTVVWHYKYEAPALPASSTVFSVKVSTGTPDCNLATPINWLNKLGPTATTSPAAGAPLTSEQQYTFYLDTGLVTGSGAKTVLLCVDNAVQNKHGVTSISVWRSDTAPTTTLTPNQGLFANAKPLTFSCDDPTGRIIYQLASTTDGVTTPVVATDPAFIAASGAINIGTLYDPNNKPLTPYSPNNPTWTVYKYRCMDNAGNIESVKTSGIFKVDSNYPSVTVANIYKSGTTASVTGTSSFATSYQNIDAIWSTNLVDQNWEIRSDGAACGSGGTRVAFGTSGVSGTPSPANTPFPKTIAFNAGTMTAVGDYTLTFCVYSSTTSQWGQDTFSLVRDDSAPTIGVNVPAGSYGAAPNIIFTCTDHADKIAYDQTKAPLGSAPGTPNTPVFTAGGGISVGLPFSGPITLDTQTVTSFKWKCIDRGGNESGTNTATYTVDTILPAVTVVNVQRTAVSNLAAAYPTTHITWTSSRAGLTYEVRNSGNCNGGVGGGGVAGNLGSATRYTGTTPAVGTNITNTLNIAAGDFPSIGATYSYKICVFNAINNAGYQTTVLDIMRDETVPVFPGPTTITTVDPLNFTITPTAATDANLAGYYVYRRLGANSYSTTPDYTVVAIPFTLAMPDSQTYFLKLVAFDIAGNTTTIGSGEITTKPTITLTVSGLAGGTFNITDGAATLTVAGNSSAPWITTLGTGSTYNFAITSQPPTQICAIRQKQFGLLVANITINVECNTGQFVAGRFQLAKAYPSNYLYYRTRTTSLASGQTNPTSLVTVGSLLYYGNYADCDGGTPGNQYCVFKVPTSSGSVATFATGLTAPVRGVATDGTNLYFSTIAPDNRIYKAPLTGGSPVTLASSLNNPHALTTDGSYLYIADNGSSSIQKLELATGILTTVASGLTYGPLGIEIVGTDLYFTGWNSHAIYRVPKTGGTPTVVYGNETLSGFIDGNSTAIRFNQPHDLAYDGVDNIFVADYLNHRVRKIKISTGRAVVMAGDGTSGSFSQGNGPSAKIPYPVGIASDGKNIFLGNHNTGTSVMRLADTNLVGYWPMNGVPSDFSSDGFNGSFNMTVTGSPTTVTGRFGETNGAYRFDGSTTWLSTPTQTQFNLSSEYTLSAWVYPSAVANMRIINKVTAGGCDGFNMDLVNSNKLRIQYCISGGGFLQSNTPIPINRWTHVLVQFSGIRNQARVFINGHLDAEASTAVGITSTNSLPLRIGVDSAGNNVFNGAMAEVRMYARWLNEGEINALAQDAAAGVIGPGFNTGPTELVSYFDFKSGGYADTGPAALTISSGSGTVATGKDGDTSGAYRFSGSQYLTTANSSGLPAGGHPRSLCAWVKPELSTFGWYTGSAAYGTTGNGAAYSIAHSLGNGYMMLWGDNADVGASRAAPINTWTHACVTYDGATVRIFVDGQQLGSSALILNTAAGALRIGCWVNNTNCITGTVDDVRIYNYALPANEVRQIAVQIPAGLMARYDFSGDTNDVSGQGINLTNTGATTNPDRFGVSNSAYHFNGIGNQMTNTSTTLPFPTGNQDRTMCFWGRADQMISGVRIGVAYGNSALDQASQIGFNNLATTTPSTLGCAFGAPCSPTGYIHQNTWHHVCMVVTSINAQMYLNGSILDTNGGGTAGTTVSAATWNTQPGPIEVGSFSGNYRFPGDLDDIRIYNRALSQVEIQTLVQQPNKRIYVTARTYYGTLMGNGGVSGAPTGGTGIAGADAKCNWASDANKPATGTYKAMLGGGITNLRLPCSSAYCATNGIAEGIDWVLRPNITYIRDTNLPIFTANSSGIFDFGTAANNPSGSTTFANAIGATVASPWTGVNRYWNNDTACGSWDDVGTFDGKAVFGYATGTDQGNAGTNGVIYQNWTQTSVGMQVSCTAYALPLYCVEQ